MIPRLHIHRKFKPLLCCGLLAAGMLQGVAHAVVDDAHSFALEAADPWVRQGVSVRYEYARGTIRPNSSAKVGYQVFRGNEYWLFAGGSEDGAIMTVKVTDSQGNEITGELSRGYNSATFRFTPERTMLVVVEVSGHVRGTVVEAMDWALVYGYRSAAQASSEEDGDAADPGEAIEDDDEPGVVTDQEVIEPTEVDGVDADDASVMEQPEEGDPARESSDNEDPEL